MSSLFSIPGAYPSSTMTDSGPPPRTGASHRSPNTFTPHHSGFSNDPGSNRPSTNASRQAQAQTSSRSAPAQANPTLNPTAATAFHGFGSFFIGAQNVTIHSTREGDPVHFNGRPVSSATLGVGVPSDGSTTGSSSSSGSNNPFRNDPGTYTTTGSRTNNNPFVNYATVKDAGSRGGAPCAGSSSSGGGRGGRHPPRGDTYDAHHQVNQDNTPQVRNYACMNTKPVFGNLTQNSVVVADDYPVEESQREEEYYFSQEYCPPPPPPPPPHPRPCPWPDHRPHGSAYFAESGGRPGWTLNNYGNMNTGDVRRGYIAQSVQFQHQWWGL
ncbi:hypothetical protein CC1G_01495 [Coprinopsis cinerea okayama7|uniref:Uncharacterized protein n=1 Tax=Coprinopsis cinerea (strain Okayama-7 / 130 / ATCC MYA-4618 / FGSC 9003) TaxID=240176 RepID=A8NHS8_COPC7|nr:hypothetical protein CC1G_01495 [Coprinopsis cinerea okayama7\|eukprot:XP_001833818.1 hypothetical protein CC1G_01495 [Coprinopsis cinerea okayama7\